MYGSREDSKGGVITGQSNMPILVGEKVEGNVLESLEFKEDYNTKELLDNTAILTFIQSNGAKFNISILDGTQDWQIDNLRKMLAQIGTKIVSDAEYWAIVDGSNSFHELITRIKTDIIPKASGKTFTLKIVYNTSKTSGKSFPGFPKKGNFIELDGTVPTSLSSNDYDVYERPVLVTLPEDKSKENTSEQSTTTGTAQTF